MPVSHSYPLTLPCRSDALDEFLSEPPAPVVESVSRQSGPILVLGAAGKMGLHLSMMLKKAARRVGRDLGVVAVSRFRALRDRGCFENAGIQTIACDLSDPRELCRLPDATTVFYLAGVKFGTAVSPEVLERMNVLMPRLVAARFRGSQIVAFSTGCVYPFVAVDSRGAHEATPTAPLGAYAQSCRLREEAFTEVSHAAHTPVVLIRLNYANEFRYGVLVDIATKVWARQPLDVTMGHVNLIWQTDAIAHIIQSIAIVGSPAVALNIGGANVLSAQQLATKFGDLFGIDPIIVGSEAPTAWLNDAARSHRLFGPPATSLETMMSWIAAWLKNGGRTWGKPTGFERRDGNF